MEASFACRLPLGTISSANIKYFKSNYNIYFTLNTIYFMLFQMKFMRAGYLDVDTAAAYRLTGLGPALGERRSDVSYISRT